LSTVKGGQNRKYEVYVISDAIGAKNDNDIEKALKAYKKLNVNTVTSEQIIDKIKL
jgi:nicotinamidase-related amidase